MCWGCSGRRNGWRSALALANVALAVSQFAEPMLFGKVIDKLTHSLGAGAARCNGPGIGPWLAGWAAFGVFSIVAGVTVALHSDRLAHRRRVVVMAAFFDHVLHLPMSFHASAHTGRLLKVMIEGASGMFGVWLSFFREHFAALVALFVLLPATLIVNWRLGAILLALVVILGFLMNLVLRKTETMQSAADVYCERCRRTGVGRARQHAGDPEFRPRRRGDERAVEDDRPDA